MSRFTGALGALALLLGLATTSTASASSSPPGSDDEWSYTDGSGETVTLDETPTRLVVHASAAAGLIPLGIRPVGIFADQSVESDPQLRGLDLSGIEIVGEEWGVINIEAVAELDPDLIVGEWWPMEEAYSGLEDGTGGANSAMLDIAPVVGVTQGRSVVTMIEDYEALAASLGADLSVDAVADERARFEDAVDRFKTVVESKPDLTVLAVSPTPESLYVAVPAGAAELSDFVTWGLNIVEPVPDADFPYWENLSWENAAKYQVDLIIVDDRQGTVGLEAAEAQPTWTLLAAAEAGSVTTWPAFWLRNYTAYADELDKLSDAIEAADEHLV